MANKRFGNKLLESVSRSGRWIWIRSLVIVFIPVEFVASQYPEFVNNNHQCILCTTLFFKNLKHFFQLKCNFIKLRHNFLDSCLFPNKNQLEMPLEYIIIRQLIIISERIYCMKMLQKRIWSTPTSFNLEVSI